MGQGRYPYFLGKIRPFFNSNTEIPVVFYSVSEGNQSCHPTVFTDRFWDDRDGWTNIGVGTVSNSLTVLPGKQPTMPSGTPIGDPEWFVNGLDYEQWLSGGYPNAAHCCPLDDLTMAITVEDVLLTNVYPSTLILQFNDADGFVATQPVAGTATVALNHASLLQAGVVDTGNQQFAGYKQFSNGLFAQKVDVNDIGGTGGTLAAFLSVTPAYYVGPGDTYLCSCSTTDHRNGLLMRNNPGATADITGLFLEPSNGGLDHGRLVLLGGNGQVCYNVGGMDGATGTGASGDHFTGGLCTGLGTGGGGVASLDGISGAVSLVAGSGVTITDNSPMPGKITIAAAGGGGVSSLNGLAGGLTIAAGTGISVSASGTTITISASGGGGGGGLTTTIGYTKPGGATGSLTFTNGLLTGST